MLMNAGAFGVLAALSGKGLEHTALDDLEQWLADFKVVAMIALRNNPQWIEKLGLAIVE